MKNKTDKKSFIIDAEQEELTLKANKINQKLNRLIFKEIRENFLEENSDINDYDEEEISFAYRKIALAILAGSVKGSALTLDIPVDISLEKHIEALKEMIKSHFDLENNHH